MAGLVRAGAFLALAVPFGVPAADEGPVPVSMELVLAVDISLSVDGIEFDLQTRGIAEAFRSPEIIDLISQHHGGVAVALLQWSTPATAEQRTRWHLLTDAASAHAFADEVAAAQRAPLGYHTGIGTAIDHAVHLIETNAFHGLERKIDVSGDGRNNAPPDPQAPRSEALARGIAINGLAILNNEPDLADYYRRAVVGGPGAFVVTADDYAAFAEAMALKLRRELSLPTARAPLSSRAEAGAYESFTTGRAWAPRSAPARQAVPAGRRAAVDRAIERDSRLMKPSFMTDFRHPIRRYPAL